MEAATVVHCSTAIWWSAWFSGSIPFAARKTSDCSVCCRAGTVQLLASFSLLGYLLFSTVAAQHKQIVALLPHQLSYTFGNPSQQLLNLHVPVQAVPADHTVAQAFMGEMFAAFVLMFVICLFGLDPKSPRADGEKIPLVVSITIPFLIYIVGPVSSMCINPARAFGPALVSGFWENHWVCHHAFALRFLLCAGHCLFPSKVSPYQFVVSGTVYERLFIRTKSA